MFKALMKDPARDYFENQDIPEGVLTEYLGRFHKKSSLGRYMLAVNTPNMPVEIEKLAIDYITGESRGLYVPKDAVSNIVAYDIHLDVNFKEDIAALMIDYDFYSIWGRNAGNFNRQIVVDYKSGKHRISEELAYDMVLAEDPDGELFENVITNFKPMSFYVGIAYITACRTTDGMLFTMPQEIIDGVHNWALGYG